MECHMNNSEIHRIVDGEHNCMPEIGLGTWHFEPNNNPRSSHRLKNRADKVDYTFRRDMTGSVCQLALDLGYSQIDTSSAWRNEHAVATAVEHHSRSRASVYITTKVQRASNTSGGARKILLSSIKAAGGDSGVVDLVLLDASTTQSLVQRKAMWLELEKLYKQGKARAIGVSNYDCGNIEKMRQYATVWPPHVNQLPVNPTHPHTEAVNYCRKQGITVQAASPFQNGRLLNNLIVAVVAKTQGKSRAQVLLAWSKAKGYVPLPRSADPAHLKENLEAMSIELTPVQMQLLDNLDPIFSKSGRVCPDVK